VQGTVREFILRTVERTLSIDLDDGLFVEWEDRPGIVATSARVLPEGSQAGQSVGARPFRSAWRGRGETESFASVLSALNGPGAHERTKR
jgi:hypothetical protein